MTYSCNWWGSVTSSYVFLCIQQSFLYASECRFNLFYIYVISKSSLLYSSFYVHMFGMFSSGLILSCLISTCTFSNFSVFNVRSFQYPSLQFYKVERFMVSGWNHLLWCFVLVLFISFYNFFTSFPVSIFWIFTGFVPAFPLFFFWYSTWVLYSLLNFLHQMESRFDAGSRSSSFPSFLSLFRCYSLFFLVCVLSYRRSWYLFQTFILCFFYVFKKIQKRLMNILFVQNVNVTSPVSTQFRGIE